MTRCDRPSSASPALRTLPDAVELCVREKDRFPCLGVIHRLEPDGRVYCTRCGGRDPGVVYIRQQAAEVRPVAGR